MSNETIEFRGCPTCDGPAQAIATPDGVRYRHVDLRAATLRQAARVDVERVVALLDGNIRHVLSEVSRGADPVSLQDLATHAVCRLDGVQDEIRHALSGVPDPQLCTFYQVSTFPDLVREMECHITKLQEKLKAKRPWETAFPPPRA